MKPTSESTHVIYPFLLRALTGWSQLQKVLTLSIRFYWEHWQDEANFREYSRYLSVSIESTDRMKPTSESTHVIYPFLLRALTGWSQLQKVLTLSIRFYWEHWQDEANFRKYSRYLSVSIESTDRMKPTSESTHVIYPFLLRALTGWSQLQKVLTLSIRFYWEHWQDEANFRKYSRYLSVSIESTDRMKPTSESTHVIYPFLLRALTGWSQLQKVLTLSIRFYWEHWQDEANFRKYSRYLSVSIESTDRMKPTSESTHVIYPFLLRALTGWSQLQKVLTLSIRFYWEHWQDEANFRSTHVIYPFLLRALTGWSQLQKYSRYLSVSIESTDRMKPTSESTHVIYPFLLRALTGWSQLQKVLTLSIRFYWEHWQDEANFRKYSRYLSVSIESTDRMKPTSESTHVIYPFLLRALTGWSQLQKVLTLSIRFYWEHWQDEANFRKYSRYLSVSIESTDRMKPTSESTHVIYPFLLRALTGWSQLQKVLTLSIRFYWEHWQDGQLQKPTSESTHVIYPFLLRALTGWSQLQKVLTLSIRFYWEHWQDEANFRKYSRYLSVSIESTDRMKPTSESTHVIYPFLLRALTGWSQLQKVLTLSIRFYWEHWQDEANFRKYSRYLSVSIESTDRMKPTSESTHVIYPFLLRALTGWSQLQKVLTLSIRFYWEHWQDEANFRKYSRYLSGGGGETPGW